MKLLFLTFILSIKLFAIESLQFGVISTVEPSIMKKRVTPLIQAIEKEIGVKIIFQTGYDYSDTINKFADGSFDIGLIGPAPYIKASQIMPDSLEILAGIKNSKKDPFRSVIISKKGSQFLHYKDLEGETFAFGSPNSTLSYYVPKYMLCNANTLQKLQKYNFLGRHDKVAQYVIMGKFAAGAIKQSVANKYAKYLQVIDISEDMPGFMIVANKHLEKKTREKIKHFLLNMKDLSALKKIKKTAIGFEPRYDYQYNTLRKIMQDH
jgi:phosphonate transport system substrate-binding protein